MKDLLLRLVGEIEQLAANQVVMAAQIGRGVSRDTARDAKSIAMQDQKAHYDELRSEIEAL